MTPIDDLYFDRYYNFMKLLDGNKVADELLDHIEFQVGRLKLDHVLPKLCVILVGKDPSSISYIRQKQKACAKTGIDWEQFDYETSVTTEALVDKIEELNKDVTVHGILVQLPLPETVDTTAVIRAIDSKKDVDGFKPCNLGKMFLGPKYEYLSPCTPLGVIRLLEHYKIPIEGKEVVVVGHSNIVGKPLATMMLNREATVTVCHKATKDLAGHTRKADILCVAVGKQNLITEDMVKEGAVVVDIGFNRNGGKITGDIDFENVSKKASYITPVPGGAGPMTVACLMENTVKAAKLLNNLK